MAKTKAKQKKTEKQKSLEGAFRVIVADPPWSFDDKLKMSDVKRGAASQYPTLTTGILAGLPISRLAADDSLLALWCPSALIEDGLILMSAWGFQHKTIFTWVKTAQVIPVEGKKSQVVITQDFERETSVHKGNGLAFGMGRYFRGCTEHALIGVRGKAAALVTSHSERNVELHIGLPHSAKPDGLQERLERMFVEDCDRKLELFARRDRPGWVCVGNECPSTKGVDIRDWLQAVLPALKVA